MSEFNFRFSNPWLLLTALPVCILIFWSLQRKKPRLWGLHAALGCLACGCAVLLLAGITICTDFGSSKVCVLLDRSDSMQTVSKQAEHDALAITADSGIPLIRFDASTADEENGSGTDIARALLTAAETLPQNTRRHIVLLTDGYETTGDMLSTARLLQSRGIRLSSIEYNSLPSSAEAQVTKLIAPAAQTIGNNFSAVVHMHANQPMNGKLLLYQDDELLQSANVRLKNGDSSYSFRVLPSQAGEHLLRAELKTDEDAIAVNNTAGTCITYTSSQRILLVEGAAGEGLAMQHLLSSAGLESDLVSPHDIPPTISMLCNYGLVILLNVDRLQMPRQMPAVLQEYVSVYGRSLLVTGGTNTLIYGHMLDTPLESILPVSLQIHEEESAEPSALMLVIDCSASMGTGLTHMASDTLSAAEMAKRGAVKCISVLNSNDYGGIISFSDKSYVLAPLTSMHNRDQVIQAISRMATIGGTMYTAALKEAQAQLAGFTECEKKHIVFISDGNPGDNDYLPVIRSLRENGITLSTIAVGEDVQISILQEMADIGGGSFFRAQDANDLPSFMLSDTVLQQINYTAPASSVHTIDGASLPMISGYIRTAPRHDAQVLAQTENGDPLYALRYNGSGICAILTTGPTSGWMDTWFNHDGASQTLTNWLQDLLPNELTSDPLRVEVTQSGSECAVRIAPAASQGIETMTGLAAAQDGSSLSVLAFAPDGRGGFTASFPGSGLNAVNLTLSAYDTANTLCGEWQQLHALNYSSEYDLTATAQGTSLHDACTMTGGAVYETPEDLQAALSETWTIEWDPTQLLAWIACVLMLCSIALRKIIRT